jgi:hypothetical protein
MALSSSLIRVTLQALLWEHLHSRRMSTFLTQRFNQSQQLFSTALLIYSNRYKNCRLVINMLANFFPHPGYSLNRKILC